MNHFSSGALKPLKLIRGTAFFIVWFILHSSISAQDNLNVLQLRDAQWLKHTDASNSLYRHITGQAYQMLEERQKEVSAISSLSGWQNRQKAVRETLMKTAGPFPEKNDLNARITGTITKEGYRVEHIIYESQPGFYVTSSMFIPEKEGNKLPAVIYCSGHTADGYRSNAYQHKMINLVKKGFIV